MNPQLLAVNPPQSKSYTWLIVICLVVVILIALYYSVGFPSLHDIISSDEKPVKHKRISVHDEHDKKDKKHDDKKHDDDKKHGEKDDKDDKKHDDKKHGEKVHESFVSKDEKANCLPRFVSPGVVDDYRLSAKVMSERGNSCLRNCATEKDQMFKNDLTELPKGNPLSYIDSKLEYSEFDAVCKEPDAVCDKNAQIISKYSPGGLLMEEQNKNLESTNAGVLLDSSVLLYENDADRSKKVKDHLKKGVVEHFSAPGLYELVLIVFFASWCPHCKNAKPTIDKIKKELHGKDLSGVKFKVVEYDSDKDKDKVEEHNVKGFPTFKFLKKYRDGNTSIHEHEDGRSYDELKSACHKHTT